jgi:hypothetical protein
VQCRSNETPKAFENNAANVFRWDKRNDPREKLRCVAGSALPYLVMGSARPWEISPIAELDEAKLFELCAWYFVLCFRAGGIV